MKFTKPLLKDYHGESVSVTIVERNGELYKVVHPTSMTIYKCHYKPLYRFNIRPKSRRLAA